MSTTGLKRRRSDDPQFVETGIDVDDLAAEIFTQYAGPQRVAIDGRQATATFFQHDYCPDLRVMTLAGRLAAAINEQAIRDRDLPHAIKPLRVTVREIMVAALLHDLGKHHEDCAPFLEMLKDTDLRGDGPAADRKDYFLAIVRDIHCRKGPCMIDRLRDAGRHELNNPFIATVARRHGEDYQTNRSATQGCWWAREINVVTIVDDYDAMTSEGPERAYKARTINPRDAISLLRKGIDRGRYEPRIAEIFFTDVLRTDSRA
jgi:hypothetical protein